MKQEIENIIKKNFPEKQDVSKAVAHSQHKFAILGHNKCLDEINTSLIADEVLKVVVKKIEEMDKPPEEEKFTEDKFENTENMNRVFMRVGYIRALKDLLSSFNKK